ncbi:hypothetical protein D3C72_2406820 [compost metagenome]
MASSRAMPSLRLWLMKSTSRMPFFAASPISMMMPITENMLRVEPNSHSAANTPTKASGSAIMMVTGSVKLRNCAARMR